jgi:hypothetical protein
MFLLLYGKESIHFTETHAKPFAHIFSVCCILKSYHKNSCYHKRKLVEGVTLPPVGTDRDFPLRRTLGPGYLLQVDEGLTQPAEKTFPNAIDQPGTSN